MFGVAPAPHYRLSRSPLVRALGQVSFSTRAKLASTEGVAPVQELLDPVFPYLRPQQVQQMSLLGGGGGSGPGGPPPAHVWHFDDDGGFTLELSADTATLSVRPDYDGFSELSDRFRAVLLALAVGAGVARADRLGIRYVNIAEVPPDDVTAWLTWFRPQLTACPTTGTVEDGTQLVTTITQSQLTAPAMGELAGPKSDIQAIVWYGLVPSNTMVPGVLPMQPRGPAYLLDIDIFTDGPQPFEPDELSRQLAVLHDQIDRFFFWAVTDDGAAYFGREILE